MMVGGKELVELYLCVTSDLTCQLLGAFAKLRKASIGFFVYVRPSVRMELLGSHRTDFHEI